jgi:phage gp29-like protein
MNIIQKALAKFLPTTTRIFANRHQEPRPESRTMDVDEMHTILKLAESGDCERLFGLYRDIVSSHSHTQGEFMKRKLAVLGDPMNFIPDDSENEVQVKLANDVKSHLEAMPNWLEIMAHLLDSTLYPVAVAERTYRQSQKPGWRWEISEISQLPHHHLTWPDGVLEIRETDASGYFSGRTSELDETRHIRHRGNLLTSVPDWWGGPMRAVVFWWLFSVMDRDWWTRFLDRFGAPFLEGTYDSSDERARYELQSAFSAATKLFGIVVSDGAKVKMHQANTSSAGDAFEKFHAVANKEISKIIVGQTLSAEGANLGLGGGQAGAQAEVRDDIRKLDALLLSTTIKTRILQPLWRVNGWDTPVPSVTFGGESTKDQAITGTLLSSLAEAGLQLTEDGLNILSTRLGLPLERVARNPEETIALSARTHGEISLLSGPARRNERQRQARRATDAVIAAASPRLAKHLHSQTKDIEAAILSAASPDEAVEKVAVLTAGLDQTEAAMLVAATMSACSCNALAARDD